MRGLDCFFRPKSVAVVGASRDRSKIGYCILRQMKKSYRGRIYPINPGAGRILGLKCYSSVKDVRDLDLAVIAVPSRAVPGVLWECVEKGVEAVVIITSGYSEIGKEGREREKELKRIIRGSKTRIIGVNCLGVYDAYSGVDMLFLPEGKLKRPGRGGIGFITQSGAFGSTILDLISFEGIGISKFISYGNQTDVKENELLEYLGRDKRTRVVVAYIEGISDGRRFMDVASRVAEKTPIVVFKAGKTKMGSRAASSHTGSLAGSYRIYESAFKQAGVLEAKSVEEMFDFAKVLEFLDPPGGDRIAVVTNGGGFGVIISDSVIRNGMKLAGFSRESRKRLRGILPAYANINNPLDLIGDADKGRYEKALEVLARDRNVDGIIVIPLIQTFSLEPEVVDVIARIKRKARKPVIACATGGGYTKRNLARLERKGVPAYMSPERAVKAMQALVYYSRARGL
jgi:acetyl coenzyme A synthetase (ADP forming)-like protein